MTLQAIRPAAERPAWRTVLWRTVVVTVVTTLGLWLLAAILPGFSIDSLGDALLAGFVVGVANAFVWPALAFLVVPLSVVTLGLGAIVLNALFVFLLLDALPGVEIDGFWTALWVVIGLVIVTTLLSALLAIDDNSWLDQRAARQARRRLKNAVVTDVPGVVFIQLDGVAHAVLKRATRSGDVPNLHRWIRDGSHILVGWETGWSSQTGVSQCGILHGSVVDMPAFRWLDKTTGELVVSNHPKCAALIEKAHSDGNGLLAHHGSSYGNLFSGDAERAVLTMSGAGQRKEGRTGAGYFGYFSRPGQATRTLLAAIVEIGRERLAAGRQRRRGVEPRVERGWVYALLRTFTTVVTRDVSVQGVVNDMCEGRAAIYVDMLGYDEVAHHSGPERVDALAVLRDLDRQVGRIERTTRFVPRPYKIVVLSDHGQTQGATFQQRTGQTLAALVAELCGAAASGDDDAEAGHTESTAWLRHARHDDRSTDAVATDIPVVLGSGSLGLISIPGEPHRLSREEIDKRYPRLIPGLAAHPEIGLVLVRQSSGSSVVLGNRGSLDLTTGEVSGEDPLEPYGGRAREQVAEVDGYATTADLMVNSRYDPDLEAVAAFEDQVSSHGGLGGPQTHPFLLYPAELTAPVEPIFTSPAMHKVLKGWLAEVGHPTSVGGQRADEVAAGSAPRLSGEPPDAPLYAVDVVSMRDEVIAAVRNRLPVDDRERGCIEQFLAALDNLGDNPFDEHADPVHVTASALIVGRRGLVLHRHAVLGNWIPPGGHIDAGEAPWEAAVREAQEETGLDLVLAGGTPHLALVDVHPGVRGHTHLDLSYLVNGDDADPSPPPHEGQEVAWYSWAEALRIADPRMTGILTHLSTRH